MQKTIPKCVDLGIMKKANVVVWTWNGSLFCMTGKGE
jgi:hypothetical protein